MDTLERLRHVLAKQLGKRNLTLNQAAGWAASYVLTLGGDKQMIQALLTGMQREKEFLARGGNPGGNPGNGSGRPVLVGAGGGERILPPRQVPGSIKRRGGKLAQGHQAIAAAEF